MPIKFQWKKLPVDADGNSYSSLEAFQANEITKVISGLILDHAIDLVDHKDEIIEILELTTDARPAARGVKKPRKPKPSAADLTQLAKENAALQDQDA